MPRALVPWWLQWSQSHQSKHCKARWRLVVWLCGLCLVCLPLCVVAAQFSGLVVSVSDGDTLSVLREQRPAKIRLYGVDAPEKQQALGLMRSNSPPA